MSNSETICFQIVTRFSYPNPGLMLPVSAKTDKRTWFPSFLRIERYTEAWRDNKKKVSTRRRQFNMTENGNVGVKT